MNELSIPTTRSSPDILNEHRVRSISTTGRTSPVSQRRIREIKTSQVQSKNTKSESLLQKITPQLIPEGIPSLSLHLDAKDNDLTSSERPSPKTPSPKVTFVSKKIDQTWAYQANIIKEGMANETCSFAEDKEEGIVQIQSKLNEKGAKVVLKTIETLIDPSLCVEDFLKQQVVLKELLQSLENHTLFQQLVEDNKDLYDLYVNVYIKVIHGGDLYTFDQYLNCLDGCQRVLQTHKVPLDFTLDVYPNGPLNFYSSLKKEALKQNARLSILDFLKSPSETNQKKIKDCKKIIEQHCKILNLCVGGQSFYELRNEFLTLSAKHPDNLVFLLEAAKQIDDLPSCTPLVMFCENETILTLLERIIRQEKRLTMLTMQHPLPINYVFREYSDNIKDIKRQIHVYKYLLTGLTHYLLKNSLARNILTMLDHPYVNVEAILTFLLL